MFQHVVGVAFGKRAAIVEHMDAVGEVGDHLHVVLDPDHRNAEPMLDAQDEAREILALIAIEAGGWLVEQQQGRLERECAGEADKLLGAEWQGANRNVAEALELDEASHYLSLEQLAISPQCGFASTVAGNPMTEADERAKLKLVSETATAIWGKA